MRHRLQRGARCGVTLLLWLCLGALPASARFPAWRVYRLDTNDVAAAGGLATSPCSDGLALPASPPALPLTWSVAHQALADVTGDGDPEWVLIVWRPWEDWPIQRWLSVPSPIAGYHDRRGDSCHLILLDPVTGRERWAGSALPVPLLSLAVGDVDGDGANEIVTLEGAYSRGRTGPASRVVVWRWSDFGFRLVRRSPVGVFWQVCLTSRSNSSILDVIVR